MCSSVRPRPPPDAASLQRTDAVAAKVEKILEKYDDVKFVTTVAGYSILTSSYLPNSGLIFVSLKDWSQRDKTAKEIVAVMNKEDYRTGRFV